MKKRFLILGILITLIVLILIGIISIPNHKLEKIYIKDLGFYIERATTIRDEIETLEDGVCKESLNAMLKRINETHFTDNVTIEKYYNAYFKDNITFLNLYEDVINSCSLDEDLDQLYVLVLSASNFPNEVKKRCLLSHEFIIKDYDSRNEIYKSADETGTYTTKALELQIINELVKKVKS